MAKALSVVGGRETSPAEMVKSLSPQDKATIMSLCMPKGANDSELALYLYRCKEQGFDPLSGELVLQKRTIKDGSVRLSFITTRDALLRKAAENPDYMGMNSGVVKEGDTFGVDTEKGIIKHSFGAKRGAILAGWAVVYHKSRLPVIAVTDFTEYAIANSNSPVWGSMPSAMIQKVAEVAALRRQFPVGVQVYTAEELALQEDQPVPVKVIAPETKAEVIETEATVIETKAKTPEVAEEPKEEPVAEQAQEPVVELAEKPAIEGPVYKLIGFQTGKSGTGTPFAKIGAQDANGQNLLFLAKGEEGLAEAAKLSEGCSFTADTYEESGFIFVRTIAVV
jgi:phage recombination protein Bet